MRYGVYTPQCTKEMHFGRSGLCCTGGQYLVMSTRTQIYLDDVQREALKLLAASRSSTVSELIRRAVNRLLDEELSREDLVSQMDGVVERLRASRAGVPLSDEEVDAAIVANRKRNAPI